MKPRLGGLIVGVAAGFVLSWARLSDPAVIRDMLLLRDPHVLFALGWAVAGTCPGPVAAMVGEGRLGGLAVIGGLFAGVRLQSVWARRRAIAAQLMGGGALTETRL